MRCPSPAYRVFISYSHQDESLVDKLESILRGNGLVPMRDKNFAYGVGFHEQIRRFIQYAHVFMPVITKGSSERGWVHQEIGFAIAQNVPVLPIAVDREPGEWLQMLHAMTLPEGHLRDDSTRLKEVLSAALFHELVVRNRDESNASYSCGVLQEDRTKMMVDFAQEVSSIQNLLPEAVKDGASLSSMVRQKGALSSFHIPSEPISAEIWSLRYGEQGRSHHHCRLQRNERLALTEHARVWGSRLIINPTVPFSDFGVGVKKVRLGCLLKFLESPDAEKTQVAFNDRMDASENLTLVGNWFSALAVARAKGQGYYQTIFTRHAPSMQAKIEEFDEEFDRLLEVKKVQPEKSREWAIQELRELHRAAPSFPSKSASDVGP